MQEYNLIDKQFTNLSQVEIIKKQHFTELVTFTQIALMGYHNKWIQTAESKKIEIYKVEEVFFEHFLSGG